MRLFTIALAVGLLGSISLIASNANDKNAPPPQPGQPGQPGQNDQRPQFNAEQFIKDHDTNNDGKLSKEELPQQLQAGFAGIDKNNDGFISKEELTEHAKNMATQRPEVVEVLFWVIDVPDREPVSADEIQKLYETLRKVDKNNDGKISKEELEQCRMERKKERVDSMLKMLDKNNDGKISKEEARGLWAQNFDQLDANKDGSLDRTELEKALTPTFRNDKPGANDPNRPERP